MPQPSYLVLDKIYPPPLPVNEPCVCIGLVVVLMVIRRVIWHAKYAVKVSIIASCDIIYGHVCPYIPHTSIDIEQQGDHQNRRRNLSNGLIRALLVRFQFIRACDSIIITIILTTRNIGGN